MFKFLKKLFLPCKHDNSIETIYVEDRIFDRMTDNDDLEDSSTFIKVDYCAKCGKILSMVHTLETDNYARCYGFGQWIKVPTESCYSNIKKFENITGIDHNKLTLWKK